MDTPQSSPTPISRPAGLSYKFQRVREKIRKAVETGELSGKLPGERVLARRFHCNAKTLSKALTDLAAEGVLDRSIGRGTYVKGSEPTANGQGPWLLMCDASGGNATHASIVEKLQQINPEAKVASEAISMRPSFVNQFTAVVDFTGRAPEPFLRDLVIRNIPAVLVGREPRTYSMHAVLIDRTLGAANLARDMILGGHRHLIAVEERGSSAIAEALRIAAQRYALGTAVDSCGADEIGVAIEQGATGIVCDSAQSAQHVLEILKSRALDIPARVSIGAAGFGEAAPPCSGYFVGSRETAEAIVRLLQPGGSHRPTTLWLAPMFVERETISPTRVHQVEPMRAATLTA